MNTEADKRAQFDEFFKISHPISVNVLPLSTQTLPSLEDFEANMPHAFKLAGQFSSIDVSALRAIKLTTLESETLVKFLDAQAKKIDWMLSYILEQQDDPKYRHQAVKFGGGGLVVRHPEPLTVGSFAELKLFLPTEHSAVYTHGEVIACDKDEDEYHIAFLFSRIRESDQELLVRATLHLQTQQLKARQQASQ